MNHIDVNIKFTLQHDLFAGHNTWLCLGAYQVVKACTVIMPSSLEKAVVCTHPTQDTHSGLYYNTAECKQNQLFKENVVSHRSVSSQLINYPLS